MAVRVSRWQIAALVVVLFGVTALVTAAPRLFTRGLVATSRSGADGRGATRQVLAGEPRAADWLHGHREQFGERSFTVQYDGWLHVPRAARYEFATASDDGSWIYLDDALVVDNGGEHPAIERRGAIDLAPGLHRFRVDYQQIRGDAHLAVSFALDGRPLRPLALDVLYPSRLAYALDTTWRPGYVAATLWSSLLLLGAVWLFVRHVHRHTRACAAAAGSATAADAAIDTWLWRLLALSTALIVWQGHYGLPTGWELDELRPWHVMPGLDQRFSNGWNALYPPGYYYVLGLLSLPFHVIGEAGALDLWSPQSMLTQDLLYRGSAMLLGVVIVYLAYRCGSVAFASRRVGLWAGFLTAVVPNLLLLAKLTKPDVPYVAAFMVAMLAYLEALRDPRPARYGLFAVAATTALCIKDQAYGLFVLPSLHLLWVRLTLLPGAWPLRFVRVLADRAILRALVMAVVTFVVIYNLPFNVRGVFTHLLKVFQGGTEDGFQMYAATAAGQLTMLRDALGLVPFMLGWPTLALVAVGAVAGWRERRAETVALLLPVVSYYAFFIVVIRYQYDRFYLGPVILLAILAGRGLHALWTHPAAWARSAAGAAALYALAYGASVDLMMRRDSRFAAEAWLAARAGDTVTIGVFGPAAYLPRPNGLRFLEIGPYEDVLQIISPEFLVVNAEHARRERDAAFYVPLLNDTHPAYKQMSVFKSSPGLALLGYQDTFRNGREDVLTNLDKINPEMRVYVRRDLRVAP